MHEKKKFYLVAYSQFALDMQSVSSLGETSCSLKVLYSWRFVSFKYFTHTQK